MDIEFRPIKPRSVKKEDMTIEKVPIETINKINNRLIALAEFDNAGLLLSEEKATELIGG